MELQDTIVLVSSSADPKTFGTGFVVHEDEERSYVVTCAHVVRDIERKNGETGRILVQNIAAEVAAQGKVGEIDLAVLNLPRLWDRKPLRLQEAGRLGAAIRVAGQCEKEKHSARVAEWLEGQLAKEICLTSPNSTVRGWQLAFCNTDRVQPGYSGGAVVLGDAVIGVAAIQLEGGKQGIAISIEALREIWPEMPENLILPAPETPETLEKPKPRKLVGREVFPSVPVWQGREKLVAELVEALQPDGTRRMLVLLGQGGMGKSALMVKLVEALGIDPVTGEMGADCVFDCAVAFKAFEGSSFDDVAEQLLAGLDVRGAESLTQVREKVDAIVTALAERRALLLLDNLEVVLHPPKHPQAGRAISPDWGLLLERLANGNHGSMVVLTSRELPTDLAGVRFGAANPNPRLVRRVEVEEVDEASAVAILREYGMQDSEADLRWIAKRVQGHPIVLELLARNYAEYPGYLRKHPQCLAGGVDLDRLLRQQLGRQSEAAQDLLRRMCVLRVPIDARGLTFLRVYREDDLRFILAELGEPVEFAPEEVRETGAILGRLVRGSLVQRRYDVEICEELFDLHRVVVEFLQREVGEDKSALLQTVYRFYQSGKTIDNPKTLKDLQPLLEAQYFAFQLGNYNEAASLLEDLWEYLYPWGHWSLLRDLYKQIEPRLSGWSKRVVLQSLGMLYREWGEWDIAWDYFQQALAEAERQDSKSGRAAAWGQLGEIERNRGNWEEAERLYRQSLQMRTELGDRFGMAEIVKDFGLLELDRGNLDEAEAYLNDALSRLEELGDRQYIAECHFSFAQLWKHRNNPDRAQHHYTIARDLFHQLGATKDLERIDRKWNAEP